MTNKAQIYKNVSIEPEPEFMRLCNGGKPTDKPWQLIPEGWGGPLAFAETIEEAKEIIDSYRAAFPIGGKGMVIEMGSED
jgi:hypothetical protein